MIPTVSKFTLNIDGAHVTEPRKTQNFEFNIGDGVMIHAIETQGLVDGMSVDKLGIQYRVVYWNQGRRYSEWVYSGEIDRI